MEPKAIKEAFEKRKKREPKKVKPKLNLNPDICMVKDFYWWAKFENIEITPQEAATQCNINADIIDEWFDDADIEKWFYTPPVKFREALKLARYSALKKVNEIMETGEQPNQLKAACYLIDQATGKAREKSLIDDNDIDDDDGLDDDMDRLSKLMEKMNG